MPGVNRTILSSVLIIMAAGGYHYFVINGGAGGSKQNTTLVRIIVGSFMLALFVSLFDLFGAGVGQVASWILLLAVGTALLTVAWDLANRYNNAQKGA